MLNTKSRESSFPVPEDVASFFKESAAENSVPRTKAEMKRFLDSLSLGILERCKDELVSFGMPAAAIDDEIMTEYRAIAFSRKFRDTGIDPQ